MKNTSSILLLALLITPPTFAAQKTVTLDVTGMNCAACPITVKKSLTRLVGVNRVDVSYEKRQAVVTFDDAQTSLDRLTRATTEAGYPSTAKDTR